MSEDYCPRLIEVALPIREISAESVRDKYLPSLHPKHIHIWWARRPMAASRAVVFASLVPDPDDPRCPPAFRQAVERHLKTHVPGELRHFRDGRQVVRDEDPYRPYGGVEDTLRNRLLMFLARWSRRYLEFAAGRAEHSPAPSDLLDDRSLVKWETGMPESPQGRVVLRVARELIAATYGGVIPVVLDPFAGGGAIPLEVQRLGCNAIANDYNPVAYVLLRATCEYPQRYGVAGRRRLRVEEFGESSVREVTVDNVLTHDVQYWATRILRDAAEKLGHLYPPGQDGSRVMAYIWARTVPCANRCGGEIPLLRSLLLSSRAGGRVALTLVADRDRMEVQFGIAKGSAIKETDGTKAQRGPARCPFCRETTSEDDLRRAAVEGRMGARPVAVVIETNAGKDYRPVAEGDLLAIKAAEAMPADIPAEYIVPEINAPGASPKAGSHRSISLELYGFTRWGQLFTHRQLVVMDYLVRSLRATYVQLADEIPDPDYRAALATYLALWLDRIAMFNNGFCRWESGLERPKTPFGGQSIPMMWDFPEINPFGTLAGTAATQLEYLIKAVARQATPDVEASAQSLLGTATSLPLGNGSVDFCITDPPYGNSIAYADLSDFFYVWLKRSLGDVLPTVFVTPQTPKEQEATSHRHRHDGSQERANEFYRALLTETFRECKRVTRSPQLVTVMFAHQSTDAWTALLSALFDAGLCPDATWPIATEMPTTQLAMGTASLETSVTVVCRPRAAVGAESFKAVKKEIQAAVEQAVHRFWSYGFRGADLIVASYGPAVGVFGKYERVERADGTPVAVPELLDFARQAARDAIAGEFRGDNLSTLYYVWANLYGAAEQSWDDARLVVQIGGEAESAMDVARRDGVFVIDGPKCRLALLADRADRRGLGVDSNAPLIDVLHRAMLLWKTEQRSDLVGYLSERGLLDEPRFWKLAQALFEVLPRDCEDWKLVSVLLGERDTLRTEAKRATAPAPQTPQERLDFGKTNAGDE